MTPEPITTKAARLLRARFPRDFMANVIADRFEAKDPDVVKFAVDLCTIFDADDALVDCLTSLFHLMAKIYIATSDFLETPAHV